MLLFAKPIAKAIEKAFDCNRCGISVIGLEVPHDHMHLVTITFADDITFTRPKLKVSLDDFNTAEQNILESVYATLEEKRKLRVR